MKQEKKKNNKTSIYIQKSEYISAFFPPKIAESVGHDTGSVLSVANKRKPPLENNEINNTTRHPGLRDKGRKTMTSPMNSLYCNKNIVWRLTRIVVRCKWSL